MSISFVPHEPEPIAQCEWCKGEIYNDNHVYNGDVICPECHKKTTDINEAMDFVRADVERFINYLGDGVLADERETITILENYREYYRETFYEWVRS